MPTRTECTLKATSWSEPGLGSSSDGKVDFMCSFPVIEYTVKVPLLNTGANMTENYVE
jgi:hypothetical protein